MWEIIKRIFYSIGWFIKQHVRITDGIIALATIIIAITAISQCHTLGYQLNEMKDTRREWRRLALTAQQNQIVQGQLVAMQGAVSAGEKSVKANQDAVRLADGSIKAAQDQFRLDQRAWVGFFGVVANKPEVGKKCHIAVVFKNTGRTPAKNVEIIDAIYPTDDRNNLPDFSCIDKISAQSKTLVHPETTVSAGNDVGGQNYYINEGTLNKLIIGETRVYVFGMVKYDDIFKKSHWTKYCYWLGTDLTSYNACKEYNDCDDN